MVWNLTKPINNPEDNWDYELLSDWDCQLMKSSRRENPTEIYAKKGTKFKITGFIVDGNQILQAISGDFLLCNVIYRDDQIWQHCQNNSLVLFIPSYGLKLQKRIL